MDADSLQAMERDLMPNDRNALVLTGGGARGAFQAGAMKAMVQIAQRLGHDRPFDVISGVSAGGINAAYYAASCHDLTKGIQQLADFWCNLNTTNVFRSDVTSLSRIGVRWTMDLLLGGILKQTKNKSLLDTSPLHRLLRENLPFRNIQKNIKAGHLYALELTATNYSNSESVSFVHAQDDLINWQRQKRRSYHTPIHIDHVMASAAIPLFFPPVKIGAHHFGDGCLRNTAPLSPSLRLGCRRLFIIGVRKEVETYDLETEIPINASIARILSVLLNAILLDATEVDLERLERINSILRLIPSNELNNSSMNIVEHIFIRPTEDMGALASSYVHRLPRSIRYLIDGLGTSGEASEMISYLLFDPDYCRYLVDMGYRDTMRREDEIALLFSRPQEQKDKVKVKQTAF